MKKIILAIGILTSCFLAPACKEKEKKDRIDTKNEISADMVPAAVKDAFAAKYTHTTEVVWETAHEGNLNTYKVKFKKNGEYMKAEFGEDGKFIKADMDD